MEPYEPPESIYEFQPPSDLAFGNLFDNRLWFSDPAKFNDLFDCALDPVVKGLSEEVVRGARGHNSGHTNPENSMFSRVCQFTSNP